MSEILNTVSQGILTLSLNRPGKMNALTREMYAGLTKGLNDAAGDFGIRAVVLTSEGDHFTAGNDITDFMNNPPSSESSEVSQFLSALLNFPKPLLAAVKGNAVGVGTTMLLHCDLVVAAPSANFSMPFASLGLVPEAGSSFLFPQLVGYQRAAKIFFTGESFGADAAYAIFNRPSAECTGNFFVDDEVLAAEGITDLEKYSVTPGTKDFLLDFFLD